MDSAFYQTATERISRETTPLGVQVVQLICASGSSFGSPQYTHPHPYFSPDNRWVIFNSDRTGIPHVYAARLPNGLLEELDRD